MIKVFISHQHSDSALARDIEQRLKNTHRIDCYLDLIDTNISDGEDLARYIKDRLSSCTQLLAVISERTRESWWVPWEIGVASEKDYPLATYAGGSIIPPEFLKKWPYLRNQQELDYYAEVSKNTAQVLQERRKVSQESYSRKNSTHDFYNQLRRKLGQ
ncbi:toll/interleukin-1 receptor domain-containing protein [Phytobacter sp. SCO41]|uniref:Toll/interleukin-1 receptor domain-containing protein n=1 Tax=Citrobacter bitternis TaxID=1585982 RepID=A0ABW1PY22_9ENTR|nr:toll/interleukin-1 receptor domain-containing protein [Phytobacter sp. SCO41]